MKTKEQLKTQEEITSDINTLGEKHGLKIEWLTDYQCRINGFFDIYIKSSRWHNIKTNKRGNAGYISRYIERHIKDLKDPKNLSQEIKSRKSRMFHAEFSDQWGNKVHYFVKAKNKDLVLGLIQEAIKRDSKLIGFGEKGLQYITEVENVVEILEYCE